jgi:hypothetical protein
MTCIYCHAIDHNTKDCPILLGKIQKKRNQNNQNIQWIFAEDMEDGRNINIVIGGGSKTGLDIVK